VAKVLTTVVTPHHACRLELTDTLNPADWSTTPTPAGYSGNVCPPTIVADLLGHPSAREYCVKCEKKQKCTCSYSKWQQTQETRWHMNLMLMRTADNRGHGVFACLDLAIDTDVGEFTGLLKPVSGPHLPGETSYQTDIAIGRFREGTMAKARVVSLRAGGITRFINHSCDPNTAFFFCRLGMQDRILLVGTIRDVKMSEELTFDYGADWFSGPDYCECGSENCKNPKPKEDEDEEVEDEDKEIEDEEDEESPEEEDDAMEADEDDPATQRSKRFPRESKSRVNYRY
jgi:hypothetical protein